MTAIIIPYTVEDLPELVSIVNNYKIWSHLRDSMPHPTTEDDAADLITKEKASHPAKHLCMERNGVVVGGINKFMDVYVKSCHLIELSQG